MLKVTKKILEFKLLKISLIIFSNLKSYNSKALKNNNDGLIWKNKKVINKKIICNLIG